MLVKSSEFQEAIDELKRQPRISLDTETTGLYPYKGDRLFSIICATEFDTYYFNFNDVDLFNQDAFLSKDQLKSGFTELLSDKDKLIYLANAKFDMHMLHVEGIPFLSKPWDVLTMAKIIDNTHMQYSLDAVAKRQGFEKLSTVEEYIAKNDLYDRIESEGKKIVIKNPRYDKVPLFIIQPYGERDAEITFRIGEEQQKKIDEIEQDTIKQGEPSFRAMVKQEIKVTQVCFEIEKVGMKIDEGFIHRAIEHEHARSISATTEFKEISGENFVDSNMSLQWAFSLSGYAGGVTPKGNPSFNAKVLKGLKNDLAETVMEYRDANKRANTYYKSFLSFADKEQVVHPNIKQAGADTFRFSITNPALQTLNKPDEDSDVRDEFEVRNSFVSRDGCYLVAIDYKQQEYRLAADYAGETDLIEQINNGADVHTATGKLMGVPRSQAKTLNFMLLYGGGVAKLCLALMKPRSSELQLKAITRKDIYKSKFDSSLHRELINAYDSVKKEDFEHDLTLLKEAHALQQKYFGALPKTKSLIDRVQDSIKQKGYIYNWAGRRLLFPNTRFAYKGPNYLIQSSGAEIMRKALVDLQGYLSSYRSRILLSIHDEILFEMVPEEFSLIPEIQHIMINAYKPNNGCFMDTDVKWGRAWGVLEKGLPCISKIKI